MGKSGLHIELAQRALVWLEARATGRGIRGCEEVIISEGYVADAAAISGLQLQYEKMFLGKSRGWNHKASDDLVWIFESKVSRGDFFNTFKIEKGSNRLNPRGNFHFVVTPKGLVTADEVPTFWGLLEQRGAGLSIIKMPDFCQLETPMLHEFAYLILRSKHECKFHIFDSLIERFKKEQNEFDFSVAGGAVLDQ